MFAEMKRFLPEVEALMRSALLRAPDGGKSEDVVGPMAVAHLDTGGKRLRARLALAAGNALGVSPEKGVPWAAACELLHNATLIHDDLQDGDRVRRGAPTVWVAHGSVQAINAGDLMWAAPYSVLFELGEEFGGDTRFSLCQMLAAYSASVIRGQASEYHLTSNGITDIGHYHAAIRGKTSALFELPVVGAALLGGVGGARASELAGAFTELGMLFQMQDDVLDLYGDKGRGELGADLKEGKISALVVEHLHLHPEDSKRVMGVLKTPREATTDAEVLEVTALFREKGALLGVVNRIEEAAQRSLSSSSLGEHPELKGVLGDLVKVILEPIAHVMSQSAVDQGVKTR